MAHQTAEIERLQRQLSEQRLMYAQSWVTFMANLRAEEGKKTDTAAGAGAGTEASAPPPPPLTSSTSSSTAVPFKPVSSSVLEMVLDVARRRADFTTFTPDVVAKLGSPTSSSARPAPSLPPHTGATTRTSEDPYLDRLLSSLLRDTTGHAATAPHAPIPPPLSSRANVFGGLPALVQVAGDLSTPAHVGLAHLVLGLESEGRALKRALRLAVALLHKHGVTPDELATLRHAAPYSQTEPYPDSHGGELDIVKGELAVTRAALEEVTRQRDALLHLGQRHKDGSAVELLMSTPRSPRAKTPTSTRSRPGAGGATVAVASSHFSPFRPPGVAKGNSSHHSSTPTPSASPRSSSGISAVPAPGSGSKSTSTDGAFSAEHHAAFARILEDRMRVADRRAAHLRQGLAAVTRHRAEAVYQDGLLPADATAWLGRPEGGGGALRLLADVHHDVARERSAVQGERGDDREETEGDGSFLLSEDDYVG